MTNPYVEAVAKMEALGLRTNSWTNIVVVAEALDRGISISRRPRGGIGLAFEDKRYYWAKGRTNLNTMLARQCAKQKEVSSRLLRAQGVPAPENQVFAPGQAERAWAWAESIVPVAVKPFDGKQGDDVFLNVTTWNDFAAAFPQ